MLLVLRKTGNISNIVCACVKIIIQHRAPDDKVELVKRILAPLKSRFVYLSYDEHDEVTANTQAVTHAAFMRHVVSCLIPV
jgi:prephenate dehydrogenase